MSGERANGRLSAESAGDVMVVVSVTDSVVSALSGRESLTYVGRPQTREQALALVALLLGRTPEPANGEARWVIPIAGGRRVVALTEEPLR